MEKEVSVEEAASQAIDNATTEVPDTDNTPEVEASPDKDPAKEEEINWDKIEPRVRKAYESERKRAEDNDKTHKEYRSMADRKFTEWSKKEERIKDLEKAKEERDGWNRLLAEKQGLREAIDGVMGRNQIDPVIKNDPVYQYLNKFESDTNQKLQRALSYIDKMEQAEIKARDEKDVNEATESAVKEYKDFFGRDPSDAEITKIYQHMTDNKVYHGQSAVRGAFMTEIIAAKVQAALEAQQAKKGISTKTSSVRSSKAAPTEALSLKEAISRGMEELNINFD